MYTKGRIQRPSHSSLCKTCGGPARSWHIYCSKACFYQNRAGNKTDNFWKRVEKTPTCWLWIGGHYPKGYGRFEYRGRVQMASHYSWELTHGTTVPVGQCVLHRCDNPPCIRPDHLFLGTKAENNRDAFLKGRHTCQISVKSVETRFKAGHDNHQENRLLPEK